MKQIEDPRLKGLLEKKSAIDSGYAGVNRLGQIVDRRKEPDSIPVPENKLLGIPPPRKLK